MKEMKKDAEFRKDLQIVRESNDCFLNSVKEISKSMSDLSKGLCTSVNYFPELYLHNRNHNFRKLISIQM